MPSVEVNGVRLNYLQMPCESGGQAEDLVLVHGLATNLAFWYFTHAPGFSKRYRVTLYDLPVHGEKQFVHGKLLAEIDRHDPGGAGIDERRRAVARKPEEAGFSDTGCLRRTVPGHDYGQPAAEYLAARGFPADTGSHFFPVTRPLEFVETCKRFRNGALHHGVLVRENDCRRFFRRSRFYRSAGAWFYDTRESAGNGPFEDIEEARKHGMALYPDIKENSIELHE